jgi:hypothetical protein
VRATRLLSEPWAFRPRETEALFQFPVPAEPEGSALREGPVRAARVPLVKNAASGPIEKTGVGVPPCHGVRVSIS